MNKKSDNREIIIRLQSTVYTCLPGFKQSLLKSDSLEIRNIFPYLQTAGKVFHTYLFILTLTINKCYHFNDG